MKRATEEKEKDGIASDGLSVFLGVDRLNECAVTLEGQLEEDSLFSNAENDFINPLAADWNLYYTVTSYRGVMESCSNDQGKNEYGHNCGRAMGELGWNKSISFKEKPEKIELMAVHWRDFHGGRIPDWPDVTPDKQTWVFGLNMRFKCLSCGEKIWTHPPVFSKEKAVALVYDHLDPYTNPYGPSHHFRDTFLEILYCLSSTEPSDVPRGNISPACAFPSLPTETVRGIVNHLWMIRIGRMINAMGTKRIEIDSSSLSPPFEEVPNMNVSMAGIKFPGYKPNQKEEADEPWPAYSRGNVFISGIRMDGRLVKRNVLIKGEPGGVFTMKKKKDGIHCGNLCLMKCSPDAIIEIDYVHEEVRDLNPEAPEPRDLRWIYKYMGWY